MSGWEASSPAASPSAMGDEKRENALLVLSPRRQNFWVPLNAENPSVLGALDAFDDAVLGDGVDHETTADFFHRLMMGGVYVHFSSSDDGVKPCACVYVHPMAAIFFARASFMGAGAGNLFFNVLIQRAAQGDVDRLRAAADAQDGHV